MMRRRDLQPPLTKGDPHAARRHPQRPERPAGAGITRLQHPGPVGLHRSRWRPPRDPDRIPLDGDGIRRLHTPTCGEGAGAASQSQGRLDDRYHHLSAARAAGARYGSGRGGGRGAVRVPGRVQENRRRGAVPGVRGAGARAVPADGADCDYAGVGEVAGLRDPAPTGRRAADQPLTGAIAAVHLAATLPSTTKGPRPGLAATVQVIEAAHTVPSAAAAPTSRTPARISTRARSIAVIA